MIGQSPVAHRRLVFIQARIACFCGEIDGEANVGPIVKLVAKNSSVLNAFVVPGRIIRFKNSAEIFGSPGFMRSFQVLSSSLDVPLDCAAMLRFVAHAGYADVQGASFA